MCWREGIDEPFTAIARLFSIIASTRSITIKLVFSERTMKHPISYVPRILRIQPAPQGSGYRNTSIDHDRVFAETADERERSNILKDESIRDILAEIHAQRPENRSVEEIDRDLQIERNAWDS
ncbi:hypothetical protein POG22_07330 [Geitlerinema sp. CS-897]|nr:hypothetical protein [Geitlerinema sp. CS-897]